MDITLFGYEINLEIVALCVLLYGIIVFNILYSTLKTQGFKDLYELMGISMEEGFEILRETTRTLKQKKQEKLQQKNKEQEKKFSNSK